MSFVLRFRLGDLLIGSATCDHLDEVDVDGLVEGRMAADWLTRLGRHAGDCESCTELIDDVEMFQNLTTQGITIPSERAAYEESSARIRRRLGASRVLARLQSALVWLVPTVAAVAVVAVLLLIPEGRLIPEVERVALVPPPTVRTTGMIETWQKLGAAWDNDDMSVAVGLLEEAVSVSPEDTSLWYYLGYAKLRTDEYSEAVDALRRADALQVEAPSGRTRWMLATALERAGRRDEACEALRSVVEIGGPRGPQAREIVERSCE